MESIYCSLAKRKWINRGFLTGPMCPIYGTGAVAFLICLSPIKESYAVPSALKPILLFIVGIIVADIVEFITSVLMENYSMRAGGIIRIENLTSRGVFVCATPFTGGLRRLYFSISSIHR